jgi:hypothetical protein
LGCVPGPRHERDQRRAGSRRTRRAPCSPRKPRPSEPTLAVRPALLGSRSAFECARRRSMR